MICVQEQIFVINLGIYYTAARQIIHQRMSVNGELSTSTAILAMLITAFHAAGVEAPLHRYDF